MATVVRHPTITQLLDVLSDGVDWYVLGVQLEIPLGTLNAIKEDQTGTKRRLLGMLEKWLNKFPDRGWSDIVAALRALEENDIANKVEAKYCVAASAERPSTGPIPVPATSSQHSVVEGGTHSMYKPDVLKQHLHAICELANPVSLAVNLHARDLISNWTQDKAIQVIGLSNYQKNAEVLNEVEKVVKYDSAKLLAFCQVLQTMPLLKRYGDQITREAGISFSLSQDTATSTTSSGAGHNGGSACGNSTASKPDLSNLRRCIKEVLVGKWTAVIGSVENEIEDFARKLFEKKIIGPRARDDKKLDAMLDGFIKCMDIFETVKECQDHCSDLLGILADIGGPAVRMSDVLRDLWRTAVSDKVGIRDFLKSL